MAGVLGFVPIRESAPRLFTFVMKHLGSRQLESVRVTAVTRWRKVVAMQETRGWGM